MATPMHHDDDSSSNASSSSEDSVLDPNYDPSDQVTPDESNEETDLDEVREFSMN